VLLWVLSSGQPPFYEVSNEYALIVNISQGHRETIIPDTPIEYAKLYTGKFLKISIAFSF
jgi:hypothetical protein